MATAEAARGATGLMTPDAFAAHVAALGGPGFQGGGPMAVAVSGGADSLGLLRMAHAAFGERLCVLTVDHGLRDGSAAEAAQVVAWAACLGVRGAVLRPAMPIAARNVQANARTARYRAMGAWCVAHGVQLLATAHHADDQAETLLMRLARGSGVDGLSGIRPSVTLFGVRVVRPLLGLSRQAVRSVLAGSGWDPVDDPANRADRFDRTAARRLLANGEAAFLPAARLAASADALRGAADALAWATDRAWESRADVTEGRVAIDPEGLPSELQRRLLLRALHAMGGAAPDGPALARLQGRLQKGGTGTIGAVRISAKAPHRWELSLAPPRADRG